MKTRLLRLVLFGVLGLVFGGLIWFVGNWMDTVVSPVVIPMPGIRLMLPTTAPPAVEALPQMTVRLALVDAATEQPVAGEIWLSVRTADGEGQATPELLGRGHIAAVHLVVDPNVFYRFDVVAAGYEDWSLALRANSLSSRTMTLPVRLKRIEGGRDA